MPLYGNTWIDTDEYPTPWAGLEWVNPSTGNKYRRNSSNSEYIYQGNINEEYGGATPLAGAVMTGPLSGAHGLPPLANPDFDEGAFVEGERVATRIQVSDLQRFLLARMSKEIRQTFLSLKKLETAATNPTTVKDVSFWMVPDVPYSSDNAMKLRDATQNGDYFDVEESALVVKQTGYYKIINLHVGIRVAESYVTGSHENDKGHTIYDYGWRTTYRTGGYRLFQNDVLFEPARSFPNAKGRIGTAPKNANVISEDGGLVVPSENIIVGMGLGDLKFTAGDRLQFKGPAAASVDSFVSSFRSEYWDGTKFVSLGFNQCLMPPTALTLRLVTLI